MARQLTFSLDGVEVQAAITKIDREKLYGSVDIEAFDEKGKPVVLQLLAGDGKTLIDKGGTALATLDEGGNSIERKELVAVNSDGDEIEPVPSSFSGVNELELTTMEDYLSHVVKSVYLLDPPEDGDLKYLSEHLKGTNIYKFPFSYRGGLEYDTAFLLRNASGIFMIIGNPADLQFVKLSQSTVLDSVEEQEISAEDIDFDLL